MGEKIVIVESGFKPDPESQLTVTGYGAVFHNGNLYATQGYVDLMEKRKADWESRSWFRKAFGLPPKGYGEKRPTEGRLNLLGSVFGNLF